MKYVVLTHRQTGLRSAVFCSEHFSHCDIAKGHGEDWVPTSAGFYNIEQRKCDGQSTTLGLKPAKNDEVVCEVILSNQESMLYLVQDTDRNKKDLAKLLARKTAPEYTAPEYITSSAPVPGKSKGQWG